MQTSEPIVAIELLEAVVEYLSQKAVSMDTVWSKHDVSLQALEDKQFVPFQLFSDCFQLGERALQDKAFGLHVGETVSTRHWGQLGYLILAGEDGFESINYIQRYARLITDAMESTFAVDGNHLVCRFHMAPQHFDRHACEFFISSILSLGKFMSEGQFRFKEIHFNYALEAPIDIYESVLDCRCLFDQQENKIIVENSMLAFTSTYRDPRLKKVLEQHALTVLQNLGSSDDMVRDIRTFVLDALPNGAPSLKKVCEHFQMSERSLQRMLAKHSLSYQELVDQLRADLAKTYISNDYSFLDIALLLGYSEQSAFHRAFKRWTGLPRAKYKKTLADTD